MAIPDYQSRMLPLLKFARDEKEYSVREAIDGLVQTFGLSEEEKKELLPSGKDVLFDNRVRWALLYLKKAGLLESERRGFFKIAQRGLEVLNRKPDAIDVKFLEQFPEFKEFKSASKKDKTDTVSIVSEETSQRTPVEILEYGYKSITQDLAQELLARVRNCSPSFFEKLVVELLVKMGYGGSRKDTGQAIGRSGDEGIDGIIKEDKLGLDIIYIQAKRWENAIERPEIMKFAGALQGQRAKKGIFITTSYFTEGAIQYVKKIESKIILIDGEQLAQLMIDYGVGVSKVTSYEIKKIDSDYFTEE